MNNIITDCSFLRKNETHCQLTPTCKGWGCKFLGTPIDEIPTTDKEKAKLFSKVYREAKEKGVLECPHYRSLFIDEVLENIEISEKRAPNDIDVVSFISNVTPTMESDIITCFPEFINTDMSKKKYHVDHYIVVFDENPFSTIQYTKYWIQLFSHNRSGVWKGMIEIPLYKTLDNDNDALKYLNSL